MYISGYVGRHSMPENTRDGIRKFNQKVHMDDRYKHTEKYTQKLRKSCTHTYYVYKQTYTVFNSIKGL